MPFVGDVVVKPIRPEGKRWELVQPFTYLGARDTFVVPAGFTTDFASVPRMFVWLLPSYGRWTQAAILHDYLWDLARKGSFRKYDADGIFNRALRELGVPYLRRWVMWAAVRLASGIGDLLAPGPVQLLKVVAVAVPTLAIVTVPALVVLVAITVIGVLEWVAYLPLKLFRRRPDKAVNRPELDEILTT